MEIKALCTGQPELSMFYPDLLATARNNMQKELFLEQLNCGALFSMIWLKNVFDSFKWECDCRVSSVILLVFDRSLFISTYNISGKTLKFAISVLLINSPTTLLSFPLFFFFFFILPQLFKFNPPFPLADFFYAAESYPDGVWGLLLEYRSH